MCDCYMHKCEKCDKKIYLHLEDYNTQRKEIKIYCEKHIPKNIDKGVLWKYWTGYKDLFSGGKFFIELITVNAIGNFEGNCYNGKCVPLMIFGEKTTKKERREYI